MNSVASERVKVASLNIGNIALPEPFFQIIHLTFLIHTFSLKLETQTAGKEQGLLFLKKPLPPGDDFRSCVIRGATARPQELPVRHHI